MVAPDRLAAEWDLVLEASHASAHGARPHPDLPNVGHVAGEGLEDGDVVAVEPGLRSARVLLRASDRHQTLLLTNRCNSHCLMCSQPPTARPDGWMARQAIDAIRHLRSSPAVLGLTGGEPLLLGTELRHLLDLLSAEHPATAVEVLTNGRLFADESLSDALLHGLAMPVSWLVPLYGPADFLHDFIVQSPGAFDETIAGLLVLQAHGQRIQLRIVLVEPVLRVLPELCRYIGRNLPFVREVALMACEPIGFALANREACETDLMDWHAVLMLAAAELRRHRLPFLFMNAPLCSLPEALWPNARRSISEWKNVYAPACAACDVKDRCSGLFAWHDEGWAPSRITPIARAEA